MALTHLVLDLSPRRRGPHLPGGARLLGLTLGAVVLAAACSGSPGASAPRATSSAGSGAQSTPGASTSPFQQALAFSACMRANGIPDFPDPVQGPGGGVSLQLKAGPGSDMNPNSPQFQTAQNACRHLQPQGLQGGGVTANPEQALKWAACMRSHGLPNFPDPTVSNGVPQLDLSGTGIDPSSPQFQSAQQACKSLSPGAMQIRAINPGGGQP
jgi:hypothetical protein